MRSNADIPTRDSALDDELELIDERANSRLRSCVKRGAIVGAFSGEGREPLNLDRGTSSQGTTQTVRGPNQLAIFA